MRRKEKEITDRSVLEAIIENASVCRLGMIDDSRPYVVPLCYGYQDKTVFIHSALQGKKIDAIRKNPQVCLQFDVHTEIIKSDRACKWGVKYQSVIAFGCAEILENISDKTTALNIIVRHYSDRCQPFESNRLKDTAIIKIKIENMTGKQSGL